jgi:hypothetical protein
LIKNEVAGQEEKSTRGPTDMKKFWAKHGPNNKVQLQFNHLGQPCGVKTSKLSNFMSSLVKGKDVSLGANTWRDVPDCEKNKLWLTLKVTIMIGIHSFMCNFIRQYSCVKGNCSNLLLVRLTSTFLKKTSTG